MKFFYMLVFFTGILLGYTGMAKIGTGLLPHGKVLSESTDKLDSHFAIITYSPLETPSPTPTLVPNPTLIPTATSTITPTTALTPTSALTPTPKPNSIVNATHDLEPSFNEFSSLYGVEKEQLKKIADCESDFNPGVYNHPYAGMYQFSEGSWTTYRNLMGKDSDINLRFGARESIETAAYVLSLNRGYIWPSCF